MHSCKGFLCTPCATQPGFGSGCSLPTHQPKSDGVTLGIGLEKPMPVTCFSTVGRSPLRKSLVLGQSDFFTVPRKHSVTDWKGDYPLAVLWLARRLLGRRWLGKGMSGCQLRGAYDAVR